MRTTLALIAATSSVFVLLLALGGFTLIAAAFSGCTIIATVMNVFLPTRHTDHAPSPQLIEKAADYAEQRRRLVIYDPETGLLARWYLQLRCQEECYRAARYGESLTLVAFQLAANTSPSISERLVEWLRRHVRESDLLGHGGDERIVLLMTNTDGEAASRFVERFSHDFATIRVGKASFPDEGHTLRELIERAAARSAAAAAGRPAIAA